MACKNHYRDYCLLEKHNAKAPTQTKTKLHRHANLQKHTSLTTPQTMPPPSSTTAFPTSAMMAPTLPITPGIHLTRVGCEPAALSLKNRSTRCPSVATLARLLLVLHRADVPQRRPPHHGQHLLFPGDHRYHFSLAYLGEEVVVFLSWHFLLRCCFSCEETPAVLPAPAVAVPTCLWIPCCQGRTTS